MSQSTYLRVPELGRITFNVRGGAFSMYFTNISDEVVYFAIGRQRWEVPVGAVMDRTGGVFTPYNEYDNSVDLRYIVWDSKQLATVVGVAVLTEGATEATVVLQAVVK